MTFWVPTHAPNHLVTHFESVSAFLLYPAPGYPGRDLPLESYLSQGRLWGGRGTSRVRLPYTGVVAMAWKPPFSPLYYLFRGHPGFGAFPRRRPLHDGLSYPWVSGSSAVVTLPLCHSILATPSWAAPYLGDALPWRRFTLTLTLTSSTPGYGTVQQGLSLVGTQSIIEPFLGSFLCCASHS